LEGGSAHLKASTFTGQHNIGKSGHISVPRMGFKHTVPEIDRSKNISALDCTADGICHKKDTYTFIEFSLFNVM